MPPPIRDTMTAILVQAQTLARAIEADLSLGAADREALLSVMTRITAQAELVLSWLDEAPLGTKGN